MTPGGETSRMTYVSFLGAGNMAGAMVRGAIAGGITPDHIAVRAGSGTTAPALAAETGVTLAPDNAALLRDAEVFVLACKPQHFSALPEELAALTSGKLVISVLAGVPTSRLRGKFPGARAVVRAMPNTPGSIGAGVTPYSSEQPLTLADAALTESLLGALGKTFPVPEEKMDAVSAVSGSGPGFLFEIVEAFEKAAVGLGLSPEKARLLVRETFIGSAKLLEKTGSTPGDLRNAVTSPKGMTLAGLEAMRAGNLQGVLDATLAAARDRSRELAKL